MEYFNDNRKLALAVGVGILSAAAAYHIYGKLQKRREISKGNFKQVVKSWKPVARVESLHIHPIKSCKGISVGEANAVPMGLVKDELQDRSFLVIDESGNFLHARLHPSMVLITASVENDQVTLYGPGMDPVTFPVPQKSKSVSRLVRVWKDKVTAMDCGDEAALWLSRYIFKQDSGARLVHLPYGPKSPRTVEISPSIPWARPTDGGIFTDETSFHLLSTESTDDLNLLLDKDSKVTTRYFRPTITVSGCSKPYEEDEWRFIKIGDQAVFRYVKGCNRCVLTTIDPATGIKHAELEPLRTLKKYRQTEDPVLRRSIGESPLLGINLSLDRPGRIRVGDIVYAGQL